MRLLLSGGIIVLCIVLPAALLLSLFRARVHSRVHLASLALMVAVVLLVLRWSILGGWYAVGAFWPGTFAAAFLAAVVYRLLRGLPQSWFPRTSREVALTGVNLLLAALGSMLLLFLMRADVYEGKPLALSAPLRGGTFYVMGGGGNWSVNHHAFIPYQRYAMDIVQVGALGFRAAGMSPVTLEEYRIFGAEILAPCEGEVLTTENGLPNQKPLDPDTSHLAGNHVVLLCRGYSLVLGHMQPGSVTVRVGETVKVGQLLGRVGNSGSTMEPHLHVHAVEGRQVDGRGIAAPVLVDGAFLIKGDTFTK
jgi:hypothetical protein